MRCRTVCHTPPRLLQALAALVVLLVVCLGPAWSAPSPKIRLQLKWRHQFQFAGYYAALEQGYFREEGLDVEFLERTTGDAPVDSLLAGRAEFAVDAPSVLVRRLTGDPLVVLAAIFQHSPSMLMSVRGSGIGMPHDLLGKRVMFDPAFDVEVSAMIAAEGMKPDAVEVVPHSWSVEDLASGRVDAMSAYLTNEPYLLRRMGLAPLIMRPINYGVDFYGDCLVTTERRIGEDPAGVEGFLRAVRRGWAYAMSHPGEMVDLIHAKYAPDIPKEQLLFEAEAMRELVRPDLVEIGHMNPERWRQMAGTYSRLGIVSGRLDLSGFIYSVLRRLMWKL